MLLSCQPGLEGTRQAVKWNMIGISIRRESLYIVYYAMKVLVDTEMSL